jgi:hypothetical protein
LSFCFSLLTNLFQSPEGLYPLASHTAKHALGVAYIPMMYAKWLATNFSDGTSKGARVNLLGVVIKGYNVLGLRSEFDDFESKYPTGKADKSQLSAYPTADQVLVQVIVTVGRD